MGTCPLMTKADIGWPTINFRLTSPGRFQSASVSRYDALS